MPSTSKEQCTFTPIKGGFQFQKISIFGDYADSAEVQVAIASFTEKAWSYAKEIARSESIPELSDIWEEALGYFNVEFVAENLNDEYRVKHDKDFLTVHFYAHYFRGLIRMPMFTACAPAGLLKKMTDGWCCEQITLPLIKQITFEKCNDTLFDFIEIPVSEKDSVFSFNKKISALSGITFTNQSRYLTMKGRYLDFSSGSTGIVFYDGNGVWELAFSKQDTVNACRALFSIKEIETKIEYMKRVLADMNTQVGFYCDSLSPLHLSVDWNIVEETDQTGYTPMEPGFQMNETAVKMEEPPASLDFDFPSIVFDVDAVAIAQKGLDKLLSKTDETDTQKTGKEIWLENPTVNITQPVFGLFTSDLPKWMEESPEKILLASKYACNTIVGHERYTGSFIPVTGCFVLSYGDRYYVSTEVNSSPPQIAFSVQFEHNDPRLNYNEIVQSMSWNIGSEIDEMFIDHATTSYEGVIAPIVEQKIKAGLKDSDFVLIMPDTQRQEIGMVVYLDLKELGIMEEVINENWVEWDKLYSQQVRQRLDYWSGLLIFMCKQAQEKFNYVSPVTVDEALEEEISKLDLPK